MEINAEDFRVPGGMPTAAPAKKLPLHQPGQRFLKGPVPWLWLQLAARLPGRAFHVGVLLWHRAGYQSNSTLEFCLRRGEDLGLSIGTTRRGIRALAAAALVTVERRPGRGLLITINAPPQKLAGSEQSGCGS